MQDVSLGTLAQLAVTLAGFSGLVAVIERSRAQPHPRGGLELWLALATSFGTLFAALLPALLMQLGLGGEPGWRVSSLILAAILAGGALLALRRNGTLVQQGAPPRSRLGWQVGPAVVALVVILLEVNALGFWDAPAAGPYFFALVASLGLACLAFASLLAWRVTDR